MAPGLIDWSAPWYEGLPRIAVEGPVHEALNRTGAAPVRFVPQAELPAGMAYERLIFETGRVPTRDNLHDFFNGLVWLRFPQAKRRLNQLQAQAIAAETRDKLNAESEARRKAVEAELAQKLHAAEEVIAKGRTDAMSNVRSIAADATAAIIQRLVGQAPTAGDVTAAVAKAIES